MTGRNLDLGWMRIFDAVGRLGSLTRAAAELGLSQPAVSYQIRKIEDQLGRPLLRRMQGGSRLTEAGEILFRQISPAVARIDEVARDIRNRSAAPAIRIFTDFGFAAFWLMPRIATFRRRHPEMEVHIVTSHAFGPSSGGGADIAVLFGGKDDFPPDAALLMPERVVPVCSPAFLARSGPLPDAAALAGAPLLHIDTVGSSRWLTWAGWLARFGVERRPGQGDLYFTTYGFVVEAARAEQGIALGWMGLIDSCLASGALVPVGPCVEHSARGYWLLPNAAPTEEIRRLEAWLLDEARPGSEALSDLS